MTQNTQPTHLFLTATGAPLAELAAGVARIDALP
jgi:hypothetical protein